MRIRLCLALLASAAVSSTANAATLDTFTISGTQTDNTPYSISFSVDPTAGTYAGFYAFHNVTVTDGTASATYTLLVSQPNSGTENISLSGNPYLLFNFSSLNGAYPVSGDFTDGSTPTINLGSYTGRNQTNCVASLRMPVLSTSRGLPTLAMLQLPVISTNCDDATSLSITQPATSSVTPEPSTLTLLGTGVLGVFAAARRRFLS